MAGYWKIPKEWILEDGLTATEAVVRADYLEWDKPITQDERARRCGISRRGLLKILRSLREKGVTCEQSSQNSVNKVPKKCEQSSQNGVNKVPKKCEQSSQNGVNKVPKKCEQSSHSPLYTPLNKEKAIENPLESQGETRTHACEAPQEKIFDEKKISEIVMRKWKAHYKRHYSTDYIPDYRSLTNDVSTIAEAVAKKMADFGRDPADPKDTASFIDDMYEAMRTAADSWQRDHWSLHTVATQFNELYLKITYGNSTDNNSNSNAGISRDWLERKMREAAGIV